MDSKLHSRRGTLESFESSSEEEGLNSFGNLDNLDNLEKLNSWRYWDNWDNLENFPEGFRHPHTDFLGNRDCYMRLLGLSCNYSGIFQQKMGNYGQKKTAEKDNISKVKTEKRESYC